MGKKIIIGLASLIVLGGGGYFFAETINSKVEAVASQKLNEYGIKHSAVEYSIFSQTLTISDAEGTYSEKEKNANIVSSAKEIKIKGISKDVINNNTFESDLICDELSLTDYKTTFSLYGNEELVTTIDSVNIVSPKLNVKELIALHNTERFSEKYFQTILDFRHDGITYNKINFDIKKASESLAQLSIGNLAFEPAKNEKSTVTYKDITFNAEPLKLEMGKLNITDIAFPNAKNLAKITNLAIKLNQIEISEANDDSIQSLTEYERLADELLYEITKITQIPFTSSSIEDVNIYLTELDPKVSKPITLDNLTVAIAENEKTLTIDSSLGKMLIPGEYFTLLPIDGVNTLIMQKFNNGFGISMSNHREFDRNTKVLTDNNNFSIDELLGLTIKTVATLPTENYTLIFIGNDIFKSSSISENSQYAIKLNEINATYNDNGFIDFCYDLTEKVLGIKKEEQKNLLINELENFKNTSLVKKYKEDQDILLLFEKTLELITQNKKELNANIKFNKPYTINQLYAADYYPDITLDVTVK